MRRGPEHDFRSRLGQNGDRPRCFFALLAAFGLLLCVCSLPMIAAGAEPPQAGGGEPLGPTPAQTRAMLESGKAGSLVAEPETDLQAAQTLPHRDLGRDEALELAEAVFEPEIEGAGGIVASLEPEKYLSDYAAVVPVGSLNGKLSHSEEDLAVEHPNTPVLIESTLPLRTESVSGEMQPVDLELERSEGEIQPQNPIAEVGMPDHVGEGISLPGPEVGITLAGAPGGVVPTVSGGDSRSIPRWPRTPI